MSGALPEAVGVLVCFAVREEAAFFRASDFPGCRVVITGMGLRNAAAAIAGAFDRFKPGAVLTCGFAGGLDPAWACGSVLFEAEDVELARVLEEGGARRTKFYCSPTVLVSVEEKGRCRSASGAGAVEMESSVIRAACDGRGVRSATLRVISDAAGEELPLDFNALMTPGGRIHFGRLALVLLRRPGKIRELIRLQQRTSAAARELGAVLRRSVGQLSRGG